MNNSFKSVFKDHLKDFIELKRTMGRKYETAEKILSQFDALAFKLNISSPNVSERLANQWCEKRSWEEIKYHHTRVSLLHSFCNYLNDLNFECFVPRIPHLKQKRFNPYIYTQKEINRLFDVIDNYDIPNKTPVTTVFCYPLLFRILYGTGIRIGEALNLKRSDIKTDLIVITDSKNGQNRNVVISESLSIAIKTYLDYQDKIPLTRPPEFIFCNLRGQKIGKMTVNRNFRKFLKLAKIPWNKYSPPRIHDLRHTFAIKAYRNLLEGGMQSYVALPILSTYLGHQSVKATEETYLRITKEMYPELISTTKDLYHNIDLNDWTEQ